MADHKRFEQREEIDMSSQVIVDPGNMTENYDHVVKTIDVVNDARRLNGKRIMPDSHVEESDPAHIVIHKLLIRYQSQIDSVSLSPGIVKEVKTLIASLKCMQSWTQAAMKIACDIYGVTPAEINSESKECVISDARASYFVMCRSMGLSYPIIASTLDPIKNHTTVILAMRRIKKKPHPFMIEAIAAWREWCIRNGIILYSFHESSCGRREMYYDLKKGKRDGKSKHTSRHSGFHPDQKDFTATP